MYRKLKLHGYLNRKRNEQKLINNFKKIFGYEKDTIVCFGDFEQKKHMKFKEPIKGKGMRTLFRRDGYKTNISKLNNNLRVIIQFFVAIFINAKNRN